MAVGEGAKRPAAYRGGWTAAAAVIAGVVGAGFASGREAAVFFVPYGGYGVLGVLLTVYLVGRAAARPERRLPGALESVWYLLVWATLAATLAAAGEIFRHLLGGPVWLGSGGLALVAVAVPGRAATRWWQGVTVLLLAGAILLAGGMAWSGAGRRETVTAPAWDPLLDVTAPAGVGGRAVWAPLPKAAGVRPGARLGGALLSALLYASYTSALMDGGRGQAGVRRREAWLGGVVVGMLLLVMVGVLLRVDQAAGSPLPMLTVAGSWGGGAAGVYAWLLGVAAANSAVANTRALGIRLSFLPGGQMGARLAVVLSAWTSSLLGFVNFVGIIYPLLGWVWLPAALGLAGRPRPDRPCRPAEHGI